MWIESPDDPLLDELRMDLARRAPELEANGAWPEVQLRRCAQSGVFRWFIPSNWGGAEWSVADIVRGYLKLSAGCLTTTFIITQYTGAARRIAGSENTKLRDALLPKLAHGEIFITVGISHLTTSKRHLKTNVLRATPKGDGYELEGAAPWVTGAPHADHVVVGATLDDGRQLLASVPTDLPGVHMPRPVELIGLNASQTGPVELRKCVVPEEFLIAGPVEHVMKSGVGAGTGGVQTSTLAVGLSLAAIEFLESESEQRSEFQSPAAALREEAESLVGQVVRTANGDTTCSLETLRTRVNSLALRSTQAALTAAKGTGYVLGHPAGRWCREALFFLVWSCPQPVLNANLCELAGLAQ